MKLIKFTLILVSITTLYAQQDINNKAISSNTNYEKNINYEKAMQFAQKYQLEKTNSNIADVDYARKFDDIAKENFANKYKNLGAKTVDVEKYKGLEKLKEKINNHNYQSLNQGYVKPTNTSPKNISKKINNDVKINDNHTLNENEESENYEIEVSNDDVIYMVEDEETLDDIKKIEDEEAEKDNQENMLIKNSLNQTNLLLKNNPFENKIKDIEHKYKDNGNYLTFFYFASSSMKTGKFNNFIENIDKLVNKDYKIIGRVIFRGLIDDTLDGIPNWIKKRSADKLEKLTRSPNIKYQFHPWAYDYFSLEEVPAYAISECKSDFKFRTCKHNYLVKGDISFQKLAEILKKNDKSFKKLYLDVVDVNEVKHND